MFQHDFEVLIVYLLLLYHLALEFFHILLTTLDPVLSWLAAVVGKNGINSYYLEPFDFTGCTFNFLDVHKKCQFETMKR